MATDWVRFQQQAATILKQADSSGLEKLAVNQPESAQLLRLLVYALPRADRLSVPAILWPYAVTPASAYVIALVVLDLHAIPTAFGLSDKLFAGVIDAAIAFCRSQPDSLSPQDISDLRTVGDMVITRLSRASKDWAQTAGPERGMYNGRQQLSAALDAIEYDRVRREILEGENPEINSDRENLISTYRRLGFSANVERMLQHIDSEFAAAKNEFKFKSVMEAVRAVLEDVAEKAIGADPVSMSIHVKVGRTRPRFSDCQKGLVAVRLLEKTEGEALQAFYNMTSVEGSHSLGSAREQARLSKNIMIEWAVLILNRLQSRG